MTTFQLQSELQKKEAPQQLSVRKLTHEQARLEQRLYWSKKSISERLAAAAALTKRMYKLRGIDLDEQESDWNPRWVPRSKR